MASTKDPKKGGAAQAQAPVSTSDLEGDVPESAEFDYQAFLAAEGIETSAENIEKLTGLLPIFNVDTAVKEGWKPWITHLVAEGNIVFNKSATRIEDRQRACFVVKMAADSHALYGAKGAGLEDARESKPIKKGDWALVPITGSLKNLAKLQAAAAHPSVCAMAVFRATGRSVPVKNWPTPMKEVEGVLVHGKHIKREGDLVMMLNSYDGGRTPKPLSSGEVTNSETGAVNESLVSANKSGNAQAQA